MYPNQIRYRETKKSCEEWLKENIGKEKLDDIQNFKFNQQGMLSLTAFIEREKMDGTSLKNRTKSQDSVFSWLNIDI